MARIETARAGAEQTEEFERDMMEEDRRVSKKAVRDIAKRQARVGTMRVKRERQVEAKRRATEEVAACMEVERQVATMKRPPRVQFQIVSD